MRVIFLLIGSLGLCMASIATLLFVREQLFLQRAEETMGEVTGYGLTSGDGDSDYCTQVQFTSSDGQTVEFEASECSASRPYEIGEQVKVYYDLRAPSNGPQIAEFSSMYLGPTLLCLCSSPFLLIGLAAFLVGGRKPLVTGGS
jgi:hypothetical protein